MNPNPDDRSDNAERIKENIEFTKRNIELADEMIAEASDRKMKKTLQEKNERRKEAINSMKDELKDEESI